MILPSLIDRWILAALAAAALWGACPGIERLACPMGRGAAVAGILAAAPLALSRWL